MRRVVLRDWYTSTVKHDGVRWYAAVVCEMPEPEQKVSGAVVGVDVGLRRLATVYDGESFEVVENPRPLKRALAKLRRLQRRDCPVCGIAW